MEKIKDGRGLLGRRFPQYVDKISRKLGIFAKQGQVFRNRLGNEEAIKGIFMMKRQRVKRFDVGKGGAEKVETIDL